MANGLVTELQKPATIISLILAVVGLVGGVITSLYFYWAGNKEGQLAFYTAQVQVFDAGSTLTPLVPTLTVLDRDHNPITDNIYAATVTVWNAGNAEIKTDDVRIPFRIVVDGNPKIIDWTPTFYTRDNMDKFDIRSDHTITWQHFDPGEGLKIRILYEAKHEQKISIKGYAVNTLTVLDRSPTPPPRFSEWMRVALVLGVMGIPAILILIGVFIILFTTQNPSRQRFWNSTVRVSAGVLISNYLIVLAVGRNIQSPPNLPF
jgi:hypothetical protein